MDCMENKYGIKEEQMYSIIFKDNNKDEHKMKGIILNFNSNQFIIKSDKGLYILDRINVTELLPIDKIEDIATKLRYSTTMNTYQVGQKFLINGVELVVIAKSK